MARQELFTARDFEKILTKDQALVARLLKIANSGMFSGSRSVKSIPEALVLIGMDNMKKIVYAVSSDGLLRQELKCYHYPEKGFWMHSMGCGTLGRAVAESAEDCELNGDEAFVAGLIHDVGKLIIDDFLDKSQGSREITLAEEVAACGLDHAELAAHIMEIWKIPAPIQEAVLHHHAPQAEAGWHKGAVVVHLADAIANTWRIGKQSLMSLGEDIDLAPLAPAMAAIGLGEPKVPQMLMDVRQNLARLQDLYEDDDLD
jgi:HD-like signal output (HDOD) protein